MRKARIPLAFAAATFSAASVFGGASLATADSSPAAAPQQLSPEVVAAHPDAEWFAVSAATGEVHASTDATLIEEPVQAEPDTVTPFLIDDPADWAACFVEHDQYWSLASAYYWGDSAGPKIINLTCGYHNSENGQSFGWHHIQQGHQGQWQQRIDAVGGDNRAWDDLMAYAAINANRMADGGKGAG